jgi:hypothetical protein
VLGFDEEDASWIAGYRQIYIYAGVVHLYIMTAFLQQVLTEQSGKGRCKAAPTTVLKWSSPYSLRAFVMTS